MKSQSSEGAKGSQLPDGSQVPPGDFNPMECRQYLRPVFFVLIQANIIFCVPADLNTGTPARRPESSENQMCQAMSGRPEGVKVLPITLNHPASSFTADTGFI